MKKTTTIIYTFFFIFMFAVLWSFQMFILDLWTCLVVRINITVYKKLDDLCRILSYSMALLIRWYFIDQVDFIWNVTIKYNNSNHVLKFCEWKSSAVQWNLG